nr:uncharacterized protein CI109_002886 [Kwoniella shandongensis]KAA5528728.1 hypothetical protein CI109_002886 [Kwoniella shandongensis]
MRLSLECVALVSLLASLSLGTGAQAISVTSTKQDVRPVNKPGTESGGIITGHYGLRSASQPRALRRRQDASSSSSNLSSSSSTSDSPKQVNYNSATASPSSTSNTNSAAAITSPTWSIVDIEATPSSSSISSASSSLSDSASSDTLTTAPSSGTASQIDTATATTSNDNQSESDAAALTSSASPDATNYTTANSDFLTAPSSAAFNATTTIDSGTPTSTGAANTTSSGGTNTTSSGDTTTSQNTSSIAIQPTIELTPVMWGEEPLLYTIDVSVGEGNNTLSLMLDTGSAHMWIPATGCQSCASSGMTDSGIPLTEGCQQESITYAAEMLSFNGGTGLGSVTGCYSNTTVTIGSYTVHDFPVLLVSDAQGFQGNSISGILGLGISDFVSEDAGAIFNLMWRIGMITSPKVGIYLNAEGTSSEIVLSDAESSLHADQSTRVVKPKTQMDSVHYTVILDRFVTNGNTMKSADGDVAMESLDVVLDTGTTGIVVPEVMLLPIYAAMGGGTYFNDTTSGGLVVPCDGPSDLPPDQAFGLAFGETHTFYIPWDHLM